MPASISRSGTDEANRNTTPETSTPLLVPTKRLNFNITERAHNELLDLSRETSRSMTELIRLGVGLLKIALEASRNNQKLVVTSPDGRAVKEIVLP